RTYLITLPPPSSSPLFPYTTLFRSHRRPFPAKARVSKRRNRIDPGAGPPGHAGDSIDALVGAKPAGGRRGRTKSHGPRHSRYARSEEHTSELQSRVDLVCRLLSEKQ